MFKCTNWKWLSFFEKRMAAWVKRCCITAVSLHYEKKSVVLYHNPVHHTLGRLRPLACATGLSNGIISAALSLGNISHVEWVRTAETPPVLVLFNTPIKTSLVVGFHPQKKIYHQTKTWMILFLSCSSVCRTLLRIIAARWKPSIRDSHVALFMSCSWQVNSRRGAPVLPLHSGPRLCFFTTLNYSPP